MRHLRVCRAKSAGVAEAGGGSGLVAGARGFRKIGEEAEERLCGREAGCYAEADKGSLRTLRILSLRRN